MTVSYSGEVANASVFGAFSQILLRWRGSIYKLVFKELIAYVCMYLIISMTYRLVLVPRSLCDEQTSRCSRYKEYRDTFENLCNYSKKSLNSVPLIFVLGFYVSLVVKRWWTQYNLLPWPDSFALQLKGLLKADQERGRLMRRTMVRYVVLSYCIALRTVSFRLKKRFPTLEHIVEAGLMRDDELEKFKALDETVTANKWFLPIVWAAKLLSDCVEEGLMRTQSVSNVMKELAKTREKLTLILSYDWVSLPIMYTQVVTLAVYFYFASALLGYQWLAPSIDLYFPMILTLQFAFFVGWLKVAETLINPFGEDDDDFELNRLVDRHIKVALLIVDPNEFRPELERDKFWDVGIPLIEDLPYTKACGGFRKEEYCGSAEQRERDESLYQGLYGMIGIQKRSNVASPGLVSRNGKIGKSRKISKAESENFYEAINYEGHQHRQGHEHHPHKGQQAAQAAGVHMKKKISVASYSKVNLSRKTSRESSHSQDVTKEASEPKQEQNNNVNAKQNAESRSETPDIYGIKRAGTRGQSKHSLDDDQMKQIMEKLAILQRDPSQTEDSVNGTLAQIEVHHSHVEDLDPNDGQDALKAGNKEERPNLPINDHKLSGSPKMASKPKTEDHENQSIKQDVGSVLTGGVLFV